MLTRVIESWDEFRRFLEEAPPEGVRFYWRGQRNPSWPLASSMERRLLALMGPRAAGRATGRRRYLTSGAFRRVVREHLERFKLSASGLRGASPKELSEEQWWALGRHYGLVTPLLDWTEKPFIALFFALRGAAPLFDPEDCPVTGQHFAMYRLSHCERLADDTLKLVQTPIDELGRMQQQRGVFTWICSDSHLDLQSLLDESGRGDLLTQACVSTAVIPAALRDLELHGIDHRLLFPDMFGAAGHANAHLALEETLADVADGDRAA